MNWSKAHYFPVHYFNYQALTIEGEGRRAFQFTFLAMPLPSPLHVGQTL